MRVLMARLGLCAAVLLGLPVRLDGADGDAEADQDHRAVLARREQRRRRARDRGAAGAAPAGHGHRREQGGRGRHDRRRCRRQVAARRLGPAAHVVDVPDGGGDAGPPALRPDRRLHAGRHGGRRPAAAGRGRVDAVQVAGGPPRRRTRQAGRAHLRIGGRRLDRTPGDRAAERCRQGEADPCARTRAPPTRRRTWPAARSMRWSRTTARSRR